MYMYFIAPVAADSAKAIARTFETWKLSGGESIIAGKGLIVTIVGICVVFAALAIMSATIHYISVVVQHSTARRKTGTIPSQSAEAQKQKLSGEVIAAIAMALDRSLNQYHDNEETVLTIKRVSRPYSPWSSKLHGMTRPPTHFHSQA
ncbi:MAG: OadG family protein [Bacteroidota bacterium]